MISRASHRKPFVPMATILPIARIGTAEVQYFTVSEADSRFTRMRAAAGHPDEYVPPGCYARLVINGVLVMSDTPFEQLTNLWPVSDREARTFLVAGLGLGMVVVPMLALAKRAARGKVVVVEQNADVIALVGPALRQLPGGDRLTIEHADIRDYRPPKGVTFDRVWLDIWSHVPNADDLPLMRKLLTWARRSWVAHPLRAHAWCYYNALGRQL